MLENAEAIKNALRTKAYDLGFAACGFAEAAPVSEPYAAAFRSWIDERMHDCMAYMSSNIGKRLDPSQLVPDAKTVIVAALSYNPILRQNPKSLQFACYAYGKDYHEVMKDRLAQLFEHLRALSPIPVIGRVFCDTAPVAERYWAWRAGIGWIGKNCNLIIPRAGSLCFIGEIICDLQLPSDTPMQGRCGTCRACIDACPTDALIEPQHLDARLCLSCQTIENREELPETTLQSMGNRVYGCDTCQLVCPWNNGVPATNVEEFKPSSEFMSMETDDWKALTVESYRRLFKGSAVKRLKYDGLMRNIKAATRKNNDTD